MKMESKSKILVIAAVIAVLASVVAAYNHFVVERAYLLEHEAACDPASESCFRYECGPEEIGCESYDYKLIVRAASEIHALCGADIPSCEEAATCSPQETACEVVYCDTATATEEMPCSEPPPIEEPAEPEDGE